MPLPSLSKAEETALAALEQVFAGTVSAVTASKKSEAAMLADIYAAPDDDGRRAVYADWLSEKGDPRGELIVLQLARAKGVVSEAALKRERSLLAKHGKAWLGQADRVLNKRGREFRRGFLARGIVELESSVDELGPEFADPSWGTLETLSLDGWRTRDHAEAFFRLPWFRHVRAVRELRESLIVKLAKCGPHPHLRELDFQLDSDVSTEDRALVWRGDAFPHVEHLAIEGDLALVRPVLGQPLARRLKHLTHLDTESPLGALVALAEKAKLTHVEALSVISAYRDRYDVWRVTLRRDAQGRFSRVFAEPDVDAKMFPSAERLCDALDSLKEGTVTEVTVSSLFPCTFRQADLTAVNVSLARFPKAKLAVPWEQLELAPPPADAAPITAYYSLEDSTGPRGEALLEQVAKPPLSFEFDSFEVYPGKQDKLLPLDGKAPFDLLKEAFAKKRTFQVGLAKKANPHARVQAYRNRAQVELMLAPKDRAAFLDWVLETERVTNEIPIINLYTRDSATGALKRFDPRGVGPIDYRMLWLVVFGEELDEWIPFKALEAAAGKKPLEWLEIRRPAKGEWRLLVFGESTVAPPSQQQVGALGSLMFELLWKSWKKRLGFLPHERVVAQLTPVLEAHGFAPVEPPPDQTAYLARHFVCHAEGGTRAIRLQFGELASKAIHFKGMAEHYRGRPRVDVNNRSKEDNTAERSAGSGNEHPIGDEAKVAKAVERFTKELKKVLLPWFEQNG